MPLDSDRTYEALFEIGAQIQAQEVHLSRVLELIAEKAAELVGADVAWLGLVDKDEPVLRIVATSGARHEAFRHMHLRVGQGIGGVALSRQQTIVVPDYASYLQETPESVRAAVLEEGIVSLIGAPMLRDGRMVGSLYVGNRRPTDFGGREASLVTALATQASIAIENSRLLEQLEIKTRLLEDSEAIHRRLTDAGLKQTGIEGIGSLLADVLRRGLVVEQDVVAPFTQYYGRPAEETSQVSESVPIMAGGERLGRLFVTGPDPLDELGSRALEHGATVVAVELLRRRTAQEVEWRLGGELLEELLRRSEPFDLRLEARAARFGIDPQTPHRIAVFETADDDIDMRALHVAAARTLAPGHQALLLTALGPGRVVLAVPQAIDHQVEPLVRAMSEAAGGCAVGVSRSSVDLRRGLREGLACAKFAVLSGRARATVHADDLGAMRFLIAVEDPAPLQDYVNEQLGRLLEHSQAHDTQLVETLRAFLELDGHQGEIAARCHIHKSTVKYRLARIGEILGRPLNEPDVRFELRLAVALADALSALAFVPSLKDQASGPAWGSQTAPRLP